MSTQGDHRNASNRRPLPSIAETTARVGELKTFFTSAFHHPREVGAAAPTSHAVAETIGQVVPTTGSPVIVELGPGTGTLSNGIHRRMPDGSRHIGIELVEELVEHLRVTKPWLEVVHGDAGDLGTLLDNSVVGKVDAVVSSIPWSLLEDSAQRHILRQVTEVLAPHGAFTALTYLHAQHNAGGRRFRAQLAKHFDEVITHTTWRNFLPILHYICRRPLL